MKNFGQRNFFVIIGPPGSGKGSLSSLLVDKCGWIQMSTGNLCRKHVDQGTEIGKRIDFALKSGKLVDDSLITQLVAEWVDQQSKNASIILDGYPRTVAQADAFNQLMIQGLQGMAKLNVVKLVITDDLVIERLNGRLVCSNRDCQAVYSMISGALLAPKNDSICDKCGVNVSRRSDDSLETVLQRLKTYYEHEKTLINFYENHGHQVKMLDVNKSLPEIVSDFEGLFRAEQYL